MRQEAGRADEEATPIEEDEVRARKLMVPLVAAAACAIAAPATAGAAPATAGADSTPICNEAENSWQGGYVVSGGIVDPAPPAFLRGSQMRVGAGAGLLNAAQHSPALRECAPPGGDDGGVV
jgi:hypothetical protein